MRGLEPLRAEPKSSMLTITSHNNRFYDISSHDETPQQLCMFYDKMLNNIVAMAGFEPATYKLNLLNGLTPLTCDFPPHASIIRALTDNSSL